MNTILLGFIVVGGITSVAVFGLLLVRAKYDIHQFAAHHEVGGYLLSVLGTLYAVVLGFVVVGVSESQQQARLNIATEVNSILNIYKVSDTFPNTSKQQIDAALLDYATAIYDKEWPVMSKGKVSAAAMNAEDHIWAAIKSYPPQTPQEQSFYSLLLDNYSQLLNSRRIRLIAAHNSVSPVLWIVLIGGAITTISFTLFFGLDRPKPQLLMTSLVCITLGLNLFLVIVYSNPFSGDFGIRPTGFQIVADFIANKGKLSTQLLQLAP